MLAEDQALNPDALLIANNAYKFLGNNKRTKPQTMSKKFDRITGFWLAEPITAQSSVIAVDISIGGTYHYKGKNPAQHQPTGGHRGSG